MPLSTKHRSSIYRSLSPLLGEEEAGALLNEFPAGEGDELVTKQFLRAEIGDLRVEMHAGFRRQTMAMMTVVVSAMSVQTAAFAATVALFR